MKHLKEWKDSGLHQRSFANAKEINYDTMRKWIKNDKEAVEQKLSPIVCNLFGDVAPNTDNDINKLRIADVTNDINLTLMPIYSTPVVANKNIQEEIDVAKIRQLLIDSKQGLDDVRVLVEFSFKDQILEATNSIFICDINENINGLKLLTVCKNEIDTTDKLFNSSLSKPVCTLPGVMMDVNENNNDTYLTSVCNLEANSQLATFKSDVDEKAEVTNNLLTISIEDATINDERIKDANIGTKNNNCLSSVSERDNAKLFEMFMIDFNQGIDNVAVLKQMRNLDKDDLAVIVDVFGVPLRTKDFKRLRPDSSICDSEKWLNCECINLSMTILNGTRKEFGIDPSIYLGNTFFLLCC